MCKSCQSGLGQKPNVKRGRQAKKTTECEMTDQKATTYHPDKNGCCHKDPDSWIRTTFPIYIESGLLDNKCLGCGGDMNDLMYGFVQE